MSINVLFPLPVVPIIPTFEPLVILNLFPPKLMGDYLNNERRYPSKQYFR